MPSSQPIRLFVARHGECQAVADGILAGDTESPLTVRGYQEAGQLRDRIAQRLSALGIASHLLIGASKLGRTQDTAAAVRDGVAPGQGIFTFTEFNEANAGDLTNRPMSELSAVLTARKPVRGMESPQALSERVQRGLARLFREARLNGATTALVVTSEGPTRALACLANNQPPEAMYDNPGLGTGQFMELWLGEDGTVSYTQPEMSKP